MLSKSEFVATAEAAQTAAAEAAAKAEAARTTAVSAAATILMDRLTESATSAATNGDSDFNAFIAKTEFTEDMDATGIAHLKVKIRNALSALNYSGVLIKDTNQRITVYVMVV